ncbi:hypothetical protein CEUSTIGMA_g722.t1 [Chlamydomonas eustigma]|uniref:Uncharacterized protein n=1 Tax=Chlamydomonas eustigma TaxID=1157962 RepID=A0A250WR19_9CHLO|nr:hypothetical protein CEUSTIGMA_g722.t1 [Chlamydomonas eustigma]|eukprot:GAX73268.1 hypothetical protein CEUSTIGMA_g722.t1 [Chlamydomonas eustigma]
MHRSSQSSSYEPDKANPNEGTESGTDNFGGYIFLDNGQVLKMPKRRQELWPSYEFSKEVALQLQLQALKVNNKPWPDHGIEIMYRFANFSPFERCLYFGRRMDLGQFERFRRVLHSPPYSTLLDHHDIEMLGSLQIDECKWLQRVRVIGSNEREERVFEFTHVQRVGGRYDGYWFCDSVICDNASFEGIKTSGF